MESIKAPIIPKGVSFLFVVKPPDWHFDGTNLTVDITGGTISLVATGMDLDLSKPIRVIVEVPIAQPS